MMDRLVSLHDLMDRLFGGLLTRVQGWLALAVLVISLAVLGLGHLAGLEVFVRGWPGMPAMVPETAIGLAALSLGVILCLKLSENQARLPVLSISLGVIVFSVLKLWGTLRTLATLDLSADHVAIGTALCFLLSALALLSSIVRDTILARLVRLSAATVSMTLCLSNLALLITGTPVIWRDAVLAGMSLYTALCFVLLNITFLLDLVQRPAPEADRAPRGPLAYVIVPMAVALPFGLIAILISQLGANSEVQRQSTSFLIFAFALGLVVLNATLAFRRWMLEQLRVREKARLDAVIDAIGTALFVETDKVSPMVMNATARRMVGPEISAKAWLETAAFHAPHSRAPLTGGAHPLAQLQRSEPGREVHAAWLDPSGSERYLRFSQRVIALSPDTPALRLIEVQDQTESWRTREIQSRSERISEIGELASGLAHEMQNIFGVVRLASDLGKMLESSETVREQFVTISRGCDRGTRMTEQLLRLSRTKTEVTMSVDLCETVSGLVDVGRANLPEKMTLTADLPEGPLWVRCNVSALTAVGMEAILNARNAMLDAGQETGRITIAVERGHLGEDFGLVPSFDLCFRDTGPGMGPEVLRQATQPYYTTRRAAGGSGLGLSVASQFALRSGGRLVLDSRPGEGTEVRLCLPVADPETVPPGSASPVAPESADAATAPAPADLTGLRILMAGDPEATPEDLPVRLEMLGADITVSHTLSETIARIETARPFDVAVIDAQLWGGATAQPSILAMAIEQFGPKGIIHLIPSGWVGQRSGPETGLTVYQPARLDILVNAILIAARHRPTAR
ncbi:ATP-binding protein [Tropicibacter sp. S64]|uniref:two-component system sensor histidine kinase NtrB n=1 Tax=Tropicibacter sp. S64 TaxID=3415122 RepID=UPI003C7A17D4